MPAINTYLTFDGNCAEAFNFYKSVFGGEFASISQFKDMPPDDRFSIADADKEKIMHVSLPIGKGSVLMGSDTAGEWAMKHNEGNNFSLSIEADSKEQADRFFNELSKDGQIIMSMEKTFWGSYFGQLEDQFGIKWMVSLDLSNQG